MNLIKKENLNLTVKNNFNYNFETPEDGVYFIEIIASAKSWWQNFKELRNFFNDDDLTLKIDSIEFPKLDGRRGLFDGEVAWNGNNLKGLSKTNVFIINLSMGTHTLTFLVDQKPTLKSIKINKINDAINYIPEDNNPAEDGDRRQWMMVVLADLPLKNLSVRAIARSYPGQNDKDDLKLIIDGEIQLNENEADKKHKYWYWSGKILDGQGKEFNKELSRAKGTHYIELWADRMPEIKAIKINFESDSETGGENTKRIPTVDDPEWTGDFNDDTEQMILARAIWGESRSESKEARIAVAWSIKNRLRTKDKRDSYHHILLDPSQYSCFWEKPPKDYNLQALRSPLKTTTNVNDHAKWNETYKIAGQIMNEGISDPTKGANHYYDDSILNRPVSEIPDWIKNGKVILKIGRLNFLWTK